jgi:hypothetical protein
MTQTELDRALELVIQLKRRGLHKAADELKEIVIERLALAMAIGLADEILTTDRDSHGGPPQGHEVH